MTVPTDLRRSAFLPDHLLSSYHRGQRCILSCSMEFIAFFHHTRRAVSPYYTWKEESGNGTFGEETYASYLSRVTGCEMYTGYGSVTHFTLHLPERALEEVVLLLTHRRQSPRLLLINTQTDAGRSDFARMTANFKRESSTCS